MAMRLTEVYSKVVLGVNECVQHLSVDVLDGVLVTLLNQPLQHLFLCLDVPCHAHTYTHNY